MSVRKRAGPQRVQTNICIPRKRWLRTLTVFELLCNCFLVFFFFFSSAKHSPLSRETRASISRMYCFDRSTKYFCTCTTHTYAVRAYFSCKPTITRVFQILPLLGALIEPKKYFYLNVDFVYITLHVCVYTEGYMLLV